MSNSYRKSRGFTLIEIAIVLLIVSVLLGYTVAMFPVQQELKQYREVEREMEEIVEHLIAFAQVNGRLPCPDTSGGVGNLAGTVNGVLDGFEDPADNVRNVPTGVAPFRWIDDDDGADDNVFDGVIDGCLAFSGFVPAGTLGLRGDIDVATGQMLDPWGQPHRYHVSDINVDANGDGDNGDGDIGIGIDLVTPNGIRDEGINALTPGATPPDLFVCSDSTALAVNHTACAGAGAPAVPVTGNAVANNVAAVIISTGKDQGGVASNIQQENTDNFHDGTTDKVYIYSPRNDTAAGAYDDIVYWISTSQLFSKMIEAQRLP